MNFEEVEAEQNDRLALARKLNHRNHLPQIESCLSQCQSLEFCHAEMMIEEHCMLELSLSSHLETLNFKIFNNFQIQLMIK